MKRNAFRFFDRLRVRWAEVDMQKIVFNGHYLMYFDTAIGAYWRAMAMPYHETMERLGGDLFVRKATLDYHGSARYDDRLDVGMRCARIGNSSIRFEGGVFRGETLLVSTELLYVFADPATQTSRAVPQPLRDALEGFEAGLPMLDLRIGSWTTLGDDAGAIRTAVFVEEQGVPAALERDEADAEALHAVAYNRFGMALGTGRLILDGSGRPPREACEPDTARIGRMAVLSSMRGSAIGAALLDALLAAARERGVQQVALHAQVSAEGFYRRAGFVPLGEVFVEAGIQHIEMVRAP